MNDNKIKKICKIERIVSGIIILIGFLLMEVNDDIGTAIILVGIFLIIILPKITKKKYNIKEETNKNESISKINPQDFKSYSSYFYKCVSNILVENKKVHLAVNDYQFPCFKIENIALKIFLDIKNQDMNPFLYTLDYDYFEKLIKRESNSDSYKYFKNKIFKYLGNGTLKEKQELFNSNITQIALSVDKLTDVKLYNNCIVNYESEKERYGVGIKNGDKASYFEKEIQKYYFYFVDSFISATVIAYLMFLSEKIKNVDYDAEFIKIILKMSDDVKDKEVVYKKLYELYKEFYHSEYSYIGNENILKVFVNIIDDFRKNKISDEEKEIIDKSVDERVVNTKEPFAQEIRLMLLRLCNYNELYTENEIKKIVIEKIKNLNIKSIRDLFELLSNMDEFINYYNEQVKTIQLKRDKENYLSGNFINLKENAEIKKEYYSIQTGIEFEKFLTKLFQRCGYETEHTGKAGDQGCDLTLKKNNYTYCVQAKYYSNTLDNTPVQEIVGSLKFYNGDRGVVITNSDFTVGAQKLAKSNNVILIDGRKLEKIIEYLLNANDYKKDILKDLNTI